MVTALLMAADWEAARAVVVGIAILTSTPGCPLPTAIRCRLPAVVVPAMVFSTVKMICEAVTPELRKVATPCVMILCLSLVKGNTAEPKICMSKVRLAVCPCATVSSTANKTADNTLEPLVEPMLCCRK